jgi:hypothetical protein
MNFLKKSSIILFSLFFMWICMPQLSAKHHSHKHRSTSFAINFNVARPTVYAPVCRPAYVERTIVRPYPVVEERVYYPYYQQVIVERPYAERVYVRPQFSYYSSWGWGY